MKKPQAELSQYIRTTIEQINEGLPTNHEINEDIHFEVTLTTTRTKSGKLNVRVASFDADVQAETTHKVDFSVINTKDQERSAKRMIDHIRRFFESLPTQPTYCSTTNRGKVVKT